MSEWCHSSDPSLASRTYAKQTLARGCKHCVRLAVHFVLSSAPRLARAILPKSYELVAALLGG